MSLHIIHKVSNYDLLVKALMNEYLPAELVNWHFPLVIFVRKKNACEDFYTG